MSESINKGKGRGGRSEEREQSNRSLHSQQRRIPLGAYRMEQSIVDKYKRRGNSSFVVVVGSQEEERESK